MVPHRAYSGIHLGERLPVHLAAPLVDDVRDIVHPLPDGARDLLDRAPSLRLRPRALRKPHYL